MRIGRGLWRIVFCALAIMALACCIWIIRSSDSFAHCIQQRKEYKEYQALREDSLLIHSFSILDQRVPVPVFVQRSLIRVGLNSVCIAHAANFYQGVITAIAGVVVAFFTATLWLVTRRSVLAIERSARTAEAALLDLERGYLYVVDFRSNIGSFFEPHLIRTEPTQPHIDIAAINHGRTACMIVEGSMTLQFLREEPCVSFGVHIGAGDANGRNTHTDFVVGPGKPHQFPRLVASGDVRVDTDQVASGEIGLFCYGWIRYVDIFKKWHPVVFCRRYDFGVHTWEAVGGSAKNYSE